MNKIIPILYLSLLFNFDIFGQNYYELVISDMIKNKADFSQRGKLYFLNKTSGKLTDYTDVIPFITDSSIIRKLTPINSIEVKQIDVQKRYSCSKETYNLWQFDNYVIVDDKIYITATLKYKKHGGRNLLVIIDKNKIIKIYNEGFVY